MTPKEAFRIGFLKRCAEAGLDREGIEKLAQAALTRVKSAQGEGGASVLGQLGGMGANAAKSVGSGIASAAGAGLSGLSNAGFYGLLLGPPAIGAAAGYGLARATDIDDEDVDSVKQQELIDEYRRSAAQLQHRNRTYRVANRPLLNRS